MIYLSLFAIISLFAIAWWALHKKMQKNFSESFKTLSIEVLEKNRQALLYFAKVSLEKDRETAKNQLQETLKPFQETLKKIDEQHRDIEKKREGAYASLSKQVDGLILAERELRKEAAQLSQALKSPQMRGSWGEIHLRRVVEIAGLLNNCDFFEQKTIDANGKIWRPDLIVHLPNKRCIAVDAKTPLNAYLDASDLGDEGLRKKKLQEHASLLRKHMKELSSKEYWKQLENTPEYVILFLPAEAFFSAALQSDPTLIEVGASQNIIVATPTTLIAILRAIAYSWKQDSLSRSAKEIARLGSELHERLALVCDYWGKVGRNLNTAVDAYNQSIASMESRVLVTARKLKESASIADEIEDLAPIEKLARQ
jgi:DNA recombination protein RmuC